ncbi:MAG: hypothetical protein KDD99_26630, partial [Bacteroidetes bacterium]|nr:hypothetical protein [Bacteroidota bacterium]
MKHSTLIPKLHLLIFTSLIYALFFLPQILIAQMHIGSLSLVTQAQVDAFSYTEVTGNLSIFGADIADVTALSSLKIVGGDLYIGHNPLLTNLDGLRNLESVGGKILIEINPLLTSSCGLYKLFASGFSNQYTAISNGLTVGPVQILTAGPCHCMTSFVLTSQAEVDAFDCPFISGNLTIEGPDIANLDALSGFSKVGGRFFLKNNPLLLNVNGLSGLHHVGNWFLIRDNPLLANLSGLSSLDSVSGIFQLDNNDALLNLDGLSNLTSVRSLEIYRHDLLERIDGLSSLSDIEYDIYIDSNLALENIDGLENITSIGGGVDISDHPSLKNVDGLSSLVMTGDFIALEYNHNLENINGLSSVEIVRGGLSVVDNALLVNIHGLRSLKRVEGGSLIIRQNALLENINGLFNLEYIEQNIDIKDNALLTDLDGLAGVDNIDKNIIITNNSSLSRFCGLSLLLTSGNFSGSYTLSGNLVNPTIADIISDGSCSGFTLVNALSDQDIGPLNDGDVIDLATLPTNQLNIRANLDYPDVVSVRFGFQNTANYRIENILPYALHGDTNGDYHAYTYTPGSYKVSATPSDRRNGKGNRGPKQTINFTIIDSNAGARMESDNLTATIYPNPAQNKL